ncbi:MAG: signal peptidase [Solirubrobacteraceae bacterium]|nr:signal peptidase [Solirubrobacteraceae bacterium]
MDENARAPARPASRPRQSTRRARAARRRPSRWPAALAATVVVVGAIVLLRVFVAEPFRIRSASMAPTFRPGDQVLVDKLAYRRADPRRGELAVFHAPRSAQILLKRIVAVGGDTVAIEGGTLVVNGRRLLEPYVPRAGAGGSFGPVLVRRGTVFVLGDNRAVSEDSRAFGPVAPERLVGRVMARVWPPGRWGEPS